MKSLLLFATLSAPLLAQVSGAGQIGCNAAVVTGTGWTTATSVNATQVLANPVAAPQLMVVLDQTTTLTVGAVTFQGDYGDGNFVTIPVTQVLNPQTMTPLTNPYTLVASTNQAFLIVMSGFKQLQLKLSTAITGTATVTPFTNQLCYNPSLQALGQQVMASSVPVAVASNQSNLGVNIAGTSAATIDSAPRATASTNILGMGAAAVNAEQTAATNGQAQRIVTDLVGKQIILPYSNPENFLQATANATGTGSTAIFASAGGSLRNYVTSCQINNTSATNSFVNLEDGSTVLAVIPAPANGGAVMNFPAPLRGTAATAFNFVAGVGVTTLYVSCQGYKGL